MKIKKIFCNIIPKYCWYYEEGNLICDYIYKTDPICNIKELYIYQEFGKIVNIKISKKYYHPNCDKDGFICNSLFFENKEYMLNLEEIIKTLSHYNFTSYFQKPEKIEILLMRYDLHNHKKNIFPLKII